MARVGPPEAAAAKLFSCSHIAAHNATWAVFRGAGQVTLIQ
jgi:hypothetical protein